MTEQQIVLEERKCMCGCGGSFRVMPKSAQQFFSRACESQVHPDRFKWGAPTAAAVNARTGKQKKVIADVVGSVAKDLQNRKRGDMGEKLSARKIAAKLGKHVTTVYYWKNKDLIRADAEGKFDLTEAEALNARMELEAKSKRSRRTEAAQEDVAPGAEQENFEDRLESARVDAFAAAKDAYREKIIVAADDAEAQGDLRLSSALLRDYVSAEKKFIEFFRSGK